MHKFVALSLAFALAVPVSGWAQDEEDDKYSGLDDEGKEKKGRDADEEKPSREEVVREIERGLYAKASIGSAMYFLNLAGVLRGGTALGMSFGSDFVDEERRSMAWEAGFWQGIHNGMLYTENAGLVVSGQLPPSAAIQGDTRTYGALAGVEYSIYPSRRIGVGLRAGGGVYLAPLLMDRAGYEAEVAPKYGSARANLDSMHSSPHPLGYAGPTFEYYTKLSHFSVGADVDVMYVVGLDLGLNATGYMKYSF